MQKREPLMDQKYFDDLIPKNEGAAKRFQAKIDEPQTEAVHKRRLLLSLANDSHHHLVALYSAGYPLSEIKSFFARVVECHENYQRVISRTPVALSAITDYTKALGLVSLGVLLEVEEDVFLRLVNCIGSSGEDAIYEAIVAYRILGRPKTVKVLWPKAYGKLYEAIQSPGAAGVKPVADFLKTWYTALGKIGVAWHDCHKGPEGGGFYGYWCYEAAAVAKVFGIPNEEFRDAPYYPKDI